MKGSGAEVRGGIQETFYLGIYYDPRQEFKCPMATIGGQISEAGLSFVTLSPGPS